jgi:hypothetical protein
MSPITITKVLGLIAAGVVSTIPGISGVVSTLNPLHYITCGYMMYEIKN